jgi:hypothetical protein
MPIKFTAVLVSLIAAAACGGGATATPDASRPFDVAPPAPPPAACATLQVASLTDFESKFFPQRCGVLPPGVVGGNCHNQVFPPKGLDTPSMVRAALVDKPGVTQCQGDKYINRADITRSFLLAKVLAPTDIVNCPSGGMGGARMPDQAVMPKPPLLTSDERACLMWYVTEVAK